MPLDLWRRDAGRRGSSHKDMGITGYDPAILNTHHNESKHEYFISFYANMICDIENYKDAGHYGQNVNSMILKWMHEGKYELTKENY